ncbi:MAG: class I SAM-dependent methyltransferase [Hyphomicrobiaceae bacterium]
MTALTDIAKHYTHGDLIEAIRAGIVTQGKTPETMTIDDLAPIDEFHIGGRRASEDFLDQLGLSPTMNVLDVGCGLGGAARFAASRYGSRVTGVDLTTEYVQAGNAICQWVRLDQRVSLQQGSALALPFGDHTFDNAYMLHVGMNIADKEKLASELARVLKAGAFFGIYDVMRTGPGELAFPVPWAATPDVSAVDEPEHYKQALQKAGFTITAERNRRDFALQFFADLRAKTAAAGGPPPLGLHVLMGRTTPEKVQNMLANISRGLIAPVELIARKR